MLGSNTDTHHHSDMENGMETMGADGNGDLDMLIDQESEESEDDGATGGEDERELKIQEAAKEAMRFVEPGGGLGTSGTFGKS